MEEKKPERDYPPDFARYGYAPVFYAFLIVYIVACLGAVPEAIWTEPVFALLIALGGLVVLKLWTFWSHLRGLYSVRLRHVFLPQVGMKAAPGMYIVMLLMFAAAIASNVYVYGFAGEYNDAIFTLFCMAPFVTVGYLASVNRFLNHGGVLADRYMPF